MLYDRLSLVSEDRFGMKIDPDEPIHEQMALKIFRDLGRCCDIGFRAMECVENGNEVLLQHYVHNGEIQRCMSTPSILLDYASFLGRIGIMQLLLRQGWNVDDHVQDDKKTALCWAASNNRIEACRLLVRHGADINHKCEVGSSPFLLATTSGNVCVMLELLCGHNVDINQVDDQGFSALHEAVEFCIVDQTDIRQTQPLLLLLCFGAHTNIFTTDENGHTPIHLACFIFAHDACTMLLTFGADPDLRDRMGNTCAHLITNSDIHEDMQQDHTPNSILISMMDLVNSMDISSRNHKGETPAMNATRSSIKSLGDDLLIELCNKNANLSVQDHFGSTVLHMLAPDGKYPMIKMVLDKMLEQELFSDSIEDENGRTAVHIAKQRHIDTDNEEDLKIAVLLQYYSRDRLVTAWRRRTNSGLNIHGGNAVRKVPRRT